eukprot:CAMPEP_0116561444 /NCGR_PEP_ID=MMETSP0397-20121206/11587_1 /TAXON_ID=216820 /ORGANISM="Cyclophora tenuis, Strain ECT3854" /LENGTH=178 /DNA_ID=CAMNT_0004087589 /DNA_START=71 /DNA_END=607 /DNA_ORIENTATION=-
MVQRLGSLWDTILLICRAEFEWTTTIEANKTFLLLDAMLKLKCTAGIVHLAMKLYPEQLLLTNHDGRETPLMYALKGGEWEMAQDLFRAEPRAAQIPDQWGRFPLYEAVARLSSSTSPNTSSLSSSFLHDLFLAEPQAATIPDPTTNLLCFQEAATTGNVQSIYQLLRYNPFVLRGSL